MNGDDPRTEPDQPARFERVFADDLPAAEGQLAPEPAASLARYPGLRTESGETTAAGQRFVSFW